jgi:hypothetical protein
MNTVELKMRLAKEGFKPNTYSMDGSPLPGYEGLILERSGERWKIDHFERGMRRELESFASEEEACQRMYELLLKHFK